MSLPCLGVFGLTEPAFKLREKPFSKKRDHPVESRYPPVWLWGRAYFPLCYYGAGRQASECDPALHQPVCLSFAPYSSTPPPATFAPLPYSLIHSLEVRNVTRERRHKTFECKQRIARPHIKRFGTQAYLIIMKRGRFDKG